MSDTERAFNAGHRLAWEVIATQAAGHLGRGNEAGTAAAWAAERSQLVRALRRICEEHGDNDWPDDLALVDVLEKHLECHLDDDANERWNDAVERSERD